MTRVPGIRAVAPLLAVALAIVLALWLLTTATLSLARQEDDLAPIEVGAGPVREQALGFTGRNRYSGESVELFGYLTAVIGLERSLLFTDADAAVSPSPQTARFTYAGSVAIASRTDRGDVTTIGGDGVLRIYLDDAAGASWDDPGSFADGEPVAELSIRLLDTLHRQAPGVGVLVGDGQLTQETAAEMSLDDERYRFGVVGISQRLRYVGSPLADDAEPGILTVGLTGSASVVAREAIAVNVGAAVATPAPSPRRRRSARSCSRGWVKPWTRSARPKRSARKVTSKAISPTLDADAVRQAAAQVATLGQTQRGIAAPEDAVAANRLVVTALSTYARGLEVTATAAADRMPLSWPRVNPCSPTPASCCSAPKRPSAPWPAPAHRPNLHERMHPPGAPRANGVIPRKRARGDLVGSSHEGGERRDSSPRFGMTLSSGQRPQSATRTVSIHMYMEER